MPAPPQLVFPYRGVYVRHLGSDQAVAEANQVLFFNGARYEPRLATTPVGQPHISKIVNAKVF